GGLGREATADLMHLAMADRDAPDLAAGALDDMVAATAGNPLLVLETTRHLLATGGSPSTLVAGAVPPSLTTIVEAHLERLPDHVRELLAVAAVIGEEFDPLLAGMAVDR